LHYYLQFKRGFTPEIINEIYIAMLKWKPVDPYAYANLIGKKTTALKEIDKIITEHELKKRNHVDDTKDFFKRMETYFGTQL